MKNCVIVSAARTAIGSFNGALATTRPSSLEQPSLEPLLNALT
jgi:acetyl-CoA acetyltransferase